MPKKLAQALMEASVKHFSIGGALGLNNNYTASTPSVTQQNVAPQVTTLQNNNADVYGQQKTLASQLLNQSQGTGPNPAQDQLNQATATNVANQGALAAGQRGASANVGLIARQAGQQGAQVQQTAAGQAATLGAQQQLSAESALATQQANEANENLQGQSIDQGAIAAQNNATNQAQLGAEGINAGVANQNTATAGNVVGGLLSGGGAALGALLYEGGEVKKMADGGPISEPNDNMGIANFSEPSLNSYAPPVAGTAGTNNFGSALAGGLKKSSGSDDDEVDDEYTGGQISFGKALLKGGQVGGKAKASGDNIKNDTQPAMLSPGEEVIDRETLQDPGPMGQMARTVAAHVNAKSGNGSGKAEEFMKHLKGSDKGYAKVAKAKAKGKKK